MLDGVRTELTPQPSKIQKWTEALDGTGLESETCSRLTRAGVNFQHGDCKQAAGRMLKGVNKEGLCGNFSLFAIQTWLHISERCLKCTSVHVGHQRLKRYSYIYYPIMTILKALKDLKTNLMFVPAALALGDSSLLQVIYRGNKK